MDQLNGSSVQTEIFSPENKRLKRLYTERYRVIMSLSCHVPAIGTFFSIPLADKISIKNTEISMDQLTIDFLKKYIWEQEHNNLKELVNDASKLDLWHVNVDDAGGVYTEEDIVQKLGGKKMMPFHLYNSYFNQPPEKEKIHIIIVQPPVTTATTLTSILSSQQSIPPLRKKFNHKFYDREEAMNQIAKIANLNYSNRLSSYHRHHCFILVPGGSGIGKSRLGMESQHLISYAEKSALMNISPDRIDLVKDALNDPYYIFIDFNDGYKYLKKLDKMHPASVRIGARIALATGFAGKNLDDLPEESFKLYRFDDVMKGILLHRFKTTHRSLEAVIIHIDEYQLYIDCVQRAEKQEWEDARNYFKEMLNEIGSFMTKQGSLMTDQDSFMTNQEMNESKLEFFIIPICTGTSAIDIHFLRTEYYNTLVHLKPLNSTSALKMFFDKYDPDHKETETYNTISEQEHFRTALFDTGFVPKFLSDFLSPEFVTPQTDWGNNLYCIMMTESVKVGNNPGQWKSIEDIRTIISFGLTRQIVERDFRLPSNASIGDIERDGLIFLAIPKNHFDDQFIIIMPFMWLKVLNQKLLPHPFFPDELLLISTADHPWRWQDFECLHGYYQKALIEALINVKNARIQYLKKQLTNTSKEINDLNDLRIRLTNEEQKYFSLSDIFRGAKGKANLLERQVKLHQLDVFIEKNKLLVKTTDIAEFKRSVLCKDGITRPLETAIFHCADECANIDHRWVLESAPNNGKPLAIFMQDKYSDLDTYDPTVSGPELKRWYDTTLQSVSSYSNDYDIVLVFFTARRFTGSDLSEMHQLLLIDAERITEYLSPTFAHRGLVSPPKNYDLEQVLSCPISDELMS